ncbi:hypothetical protein IKF88_00555 [Candidatus Saccharibacteria bacterium]|nr:hypothetical protein [Candidatus Saccharibacteria bacterium]
MSKEDLVSIGDRTTAEQQEITRKGGIASGKARREKRDRHKRIQELFALAVKDPKLKANLEKMGIDVTDADLETAADARVMVELLRKGDYKAWQAMKSEAYGPLATKSEVEFSGEVNGITINVKNFSKGEEK